MEALDVIHCYVCLRPFLSFPMVPGITVEWEIFRGFFLLLKMWFTPSFSVLRNSLQIPVLRGLGSSADDCNGHSFGVGAIIVESPHFD